LGIGQRGQEVSLDFTRVLEERFELMHRLVGSPPLDLPIENWLQLYALVVDYAPDLVIELGRGWGNSTCVFTEASGLVGCRVVSLGNDSERAWETRTAPRLKEVLESSWFDPLTVLNADITTVDSRPLVRGSARPLVFWDAHGTSVADAILKRLFPVLPSDNRVVVDDIWPSREKYGLKAKYQAGPLWSLFDELPRLWEYLDERQIVFEVSDRWVSFTARAE